LIITILDVFIIFSKGTGLGRKKGVGWLFSRKETIINFRKQTHYHKDRLKIKRLLVDPREIRRVAKVLDDLDLVQRAKRDALRWRQTKPKEIHLVTHSDVSGNIGFLVCDLSASPQIIEFALLFDVSNTVSRQDATCLMQQHAEEVLQKCTNQDPPLLIVPEAGNN
jgi:hypothetical protein